MSAESFWCLLACSATASTAAAATIVFTDRVTWLAAVANPVTTIDFEGIAPSADPRRRRRTWCLEDASAAPRYRTLASAPSSATGVRARRCSRMRRPSRRGHPCQPDERLWVRLWRDGVLLRHTLSGWRRQRDAVERRDCVRRQPANHPAVRCRLDRPYKEREPAHLPHLRHRRQRVVREHARDAGAGALHSALLVGAVAGWMRRRQQPHGPARVRGSRFNVHSEP